MSTAIQWSSYLTSLLIKDEIVALESLLNPVARAINSSDEVIVGRIR